MPDYRETVEKLRTAQHEIYEVCSGKAYDAVSDALALLTAQADELATLRAENERLTGLVSHLITQETP